MTSANTTILKQARRASRRSLILVAVFSCIINLSMLAGPLYMLQVYDRVLTSKSIDTLIALSALLLGIFLVAGCLEFVRTRILARTGEQLEARVAPAIFDATLRKRIARAHDDDGQSLNDLASVRDFLSGNALPAFFDLPWVPVYLLILAILHPVLGLLGLGGALFLLTLAWMNNRLTGEPMKRYAQTIVVGREMAEASRKNAEAVQAMGMTGSLRRYWLNNYNEANSHKTRGHDRSSLFAVISKNSRLILQSAALGVGAGLVIAGEFTAGSMIAGTILLGRGLAPVDQAIAHWRSYTGAKVSYVRLDQLLATYPEAVERIVQRSPTRTVDVEQVYARPPGAKKAIVADINFSLFAGEALAVLGASAAGKSSLARLLAGVWMPQAGHVRIDGVALHQWNFDELGQHIGYLPQDVELFTGTIGQNISRFQIDATDMEIVAAAETADVHEMVLQMPEGYETAIGEGGRNLSGGQRQRIGLARALFREPFLIVLDEPNANLDAEGDEALAAAIASIKQRCGIAIVNSHRPSIIQSVDKVLLLENGRQRAFGPKAEVLPRVIRPASNITPITNHAAQ